MLARAQVLLVAAVLGVAACSGGSVGRMAVGTPGDGAAGTDGGAGPGDDGASLFDATSDGAGAGSDGDAADSLAGDAAATDTIADGIGGGDVRLADADGPPSPPVRRTVGDLYCPAGANLTADPLAGQATPTLIPIAPPGGIAFLEGPLWLADQGVLLFSEFTGGHRILRLTPPQTLDVFLPDTGTNGLTVSPDGASLLVVSETPGRTIFRVDLGNRAAQVMVPDFNGQPFVQPNDLVVRADGTIFFTDYQAGRLYRRTVGGTVSLVASQMHANGVGLSPDETTLYLNADTHTVKYGLDADGNLGSGTDLAAGLAGADGLAIDCAGNVYIAQNNGGAVVVLSPAGRRLGQIGGLPQVVTNAAFGGADRQTLYITTSGALYAVRLGVPGLPS